MVKEGSIYYFNLIVFVTQIRTIFEIFDNSRANYVLVKLQ